jgi:hypothetical protein
MIVFIKYENMDDTVILTAAGEEGEGAGRGESKELPKLAGAFPSPRTTPK